MLIFIFLIVNLIKKINQQKSTKAQPLQKREYIEKGTVRKIIFQLYVTTERLDKVYKVHKYL